MSIDEIKQWLEENPRAEYKISPMNTLACNFEGKEIMESIKAGVKSKEYSMHEVIGLLFVAGAIS